MIFLLKIFRFFIKVMLGLMLSTVVLIIVLWVFVFLSDEYFEYKTDCHIFYPGPIYGGYGGSGNTNILICPVADGWISGYEYSKLVNNYLVISTNGVLEGKHETWCYGKERNYYIYDVRNKKMTKADELAVRDFFKKHNISIGDYFFEQSEKYLEHYAHDLDTDNCRFYLENNKK